MIEIMPESTGSVFAVKATGILTEADYREVFIPGLAEMFKQFGRIRLLMYMTEGCEGWQLHALWDDAVFGFEHREGFEKVAVVSGSRWVQWGVKIGAHLVKGKVKTFPEEQLQEDLDWIKLYSSLYGNTR